MKRSRRYPLFLIALIMALCLTQVKPILAQETETSTAATDETLETGIQVVVVLVVFVAAVFVILLVLKPTWAVWWLEIWLRSIPYLLSILSKRSSSSSSSSDDNHFSGGSSGGGGSNQRY